jgi:hypothetical protein
LGNISQSQRDTLREFYFIIKMSVRIKLHFDIAEYRAKIHCVLGSESPAVHFDKSLKVQSLLLYIEIQALRFRVF